MFLSKGLKTAVFVDGTINDPSDVDKGYLIVTKAGV
jgi:hypothetical protein